MRYLQYLLALILLTAAPFAAAEQLLREVIQHSSAAADSGDAPEIEVILGLNLQLASAFTSDDGLTYKAALRDEAGTVKDWEFAELSFREQGYDINRVVMEGSSKRGFTLSVEFAVPTVAVTLPQYASDRIALKYVSRKEFDRTASEARSGGRDDLWAVELGLSQPPLSISETPRSLLLNRVLYPAPDASGHVRLGFFDAGKARSVQRQLQGNYPDATLVPVSAAEFVYGGRMRLNSPRIERLFSSAPDAAQEPADQAVAPRIEIATATPGTLGDEPDQAPARLESWRSDADRAVLTEAKEAYLKGDYDRAITLYAKAAAVPAFRVEALEMLGVSREQKRQFAEARSAYETLLAEHPSGAVAERVDARLQALNRMNQNPRALRKPSKTAAVRWNTTASLSQFYRRYSLDISGQDETIPIDGLYSDLNVSTRRASSQSTHEARVTLGHAQDFTERERAQGLRVQEAYWDSSFDALRTSFRIGRQQQRTSGALGRFDGLSLGFRATDNIRINAYAGYLMDSSYDEPGSDRPFWAVNTEIHLLGESLTLTPFYVQQEYDGVTDRQALGTQAQLITDRGSYFGMFDYDLHHQVLNRAYLSTNLRLSERTRFYGTLDHRHNPYLTTRNALIGQPARDLSELELEMAAANFTSDLEELAADRSSVSTMLRLGLDQQIGDDWTLATDISFTDFDSTETSLNVAALDPHQDLYFSSQLRANNAYGAGNYGALQIRYFETDASRTAGILLDNRFGLWEDWLLYPRMSVDQREYLDSGQTQLRVRPSLRLDFRHSRSLRFEFEVGYEWMQRELANQDIDMQGLFLRAGYRALF
ncbi:MAG: hypothetical protein R3E86_05310 [Pseudomonadales bacterium]